MTTLASNLELSGYILRSGGAGGADTAFEVGVSDINHKEIYLPWRGFNHHGSELHHISNGAMRMAAHYHPAWDRCSPAAKKFHARNCYQVLGQDLTESSAFVLCWTPNGDVTGGTGQAMRIAMAELVPVINLANRGWEELFDYHMEIANV
jgi:hypothetical protein